MNDVIFYYLRDNELNKKDKCAKKGQPFGVVAMRINEDGTINRGVSICSPQDNFNRIAGKGIAIKRLMEAENKKNSKCFGVYVGEFDKMNIHNMPFKECYSYHTEPNESESCIIGKPE